MVRGSNLLPKQLRSLGKSDGWLNRTVTSNLLAVSSLACAHPIHTVVAIALFASTSYVGLLQESLFDSGLKSLQHNGRVDVEALLQGSRTLELSEKTAWKWQFLEDSSVPQVSLVSSFWADTRQN
jgi:hydroxymethylglutaryl-CoA reductase (NADPH)